MRVTESMRLLQAQVSMERSASRMHELNEKAATGLEVRRPSDDPAAYASIVRRSAQLEDFTQRKENISRAEGDLNLAEGVLASAGDLMLRARELAVQMPDGSYGATERAAAANEVSTIREQLMAIANSRGSRGYLFGGTATTTAPIDATGAFVGNDGTMVVEYAEGQFMASNVSGARTFTGLGGGRDVFVDLDDLATALATDNQTAVHTMIDTMDEGHKQLVVARAEAGVRISRLVSAAGVTESALTIALEQQSDEQEIDQVRTFSDLSAAQSAYERTLAVTRQILSLASAVERF